MARKKIVAGTWTMNLDRAKARCRLPRIGDAGARACHGGHESGGDERRDHVDASLVLGAAALAREQVIAVLLRILWFETEHTGQDGRGVIGRAGRPAQPTSNGVVIFL